MSDQQSALTPGIQESPAFIKYHGSVIGFDHHAKGVNNQEAVDVRLAGDYMIALLAGGVEREGGEPVHNELGSRLAVNIGLRIFEQMIEAHGHVTLDGVLREIANRCLDVLKPILPAGATKSETSEFLETHFGVTLLGAAVGQTQSTIFH